MQETMRLNLRKFENYSNTEINLRLAANKFEPVNFQIELKDSTIFHCREFAGSVVSTNADEYARRGQTNIALIKHQIATGKLAECGVWNWLHFIGHKLKKPDFSVYGPNQKSHDPDLICEGIPIHVKCIESESSEKYGLSWLFEKNHNAEGLIALCELENLLLCKFYGFINTKHVKWSEPKLRHLKTKKALYFLQQDLERLSFFID